MKKNNQSVGLVGRRRSFALEQERTSRKQLGDAWDPPWIVGGVEPDLGEDLLVRIYDEGNSTGLSFYVQLKSTKSLAKFVPKRRQDAVSYSFETKDLLHWEGSFPPVVLVIWDVEQKKGVWRDVPGAIKALDQNGPTWRSRKSARIEFPHGQGTDDVGRELLRATIADLALPVLSRGRETVIKPTFSFPATPRGRARFAALRRTLDEGGSVTIGQDFIKKWKMSDWWERAYGVRVPTSVTISSSASSATFSLLLQVVGPQHVESMPVHLKRTRAGRKKATFETERGSPIKMSLVLDESVKGKFGVSASISFDHPCETPYDSLALTRFLIALKEGGALQLALPDGRVLAQPNFDAKGGRTLDELLRWQPVLEKVTYIQGRVGRFGNLRVNRLTDKDLPVIERLYSILQTGAWKTRMSFSATLGPSFELSEDATQNGRFSVTIDGFGEERLLGTTIPLGRVVLDFLEPGDLLQQVRDVRDGKSTTRQIQVKDTPVAQRFLDWEPPKPGPEQVGQDASSFKTKASRRPGRRKRASSKRRLSSAK